MYLLCTSSGPAQCVGGCLCLPSWHQRPNAPKPAPMPAEWKPMYHPTPEQAEADRRAAYESGVPHGYVAPGDKYRDLPSITLRVVSELVSWSWVVGRVVGTGVVCWCGGAGTGSSAVLSGWQSTMRMPFIPAGLPHCNRALPPTLSTHCLQPPSHPLAPHLTCACLQHSEDEYGDEVGPDGRHRGGPFTIQVSPKMRVEELRKAIRVSEARAGEVWCGPALLLHPTHCQGSLPADGGGMCRMLRRCPAGASCACTGQGRHHPRPAAAVLRGQEHGRLATHAGAVSVAGLRRARPCGAAVAPALAGGCTGLQSSCAHLLMAGALTCSYGISYWHAKFPEWPLKIRRCEC